jgi:hypothetical protein
MIPMKRAPRSCARQLASAAGLAEVIEWRADFAPEEFRRLLAEGDAAAVPMQKARESSSASLRGTLAAGAPVIVTQLMFFEEAEDVVAELPDTHPVALAESLAASRTGMHVSSASLDESMS